MRLNVQGILFTTKLGTMIPRANMRLPKVLFHLTMEHPLHVHQCEDEAFYILDGDFEIEGGGETFTVGPGSLHCYRKGFLIDSSICPTNPNRTTPAPRNDRRIT
jgi:quercetin dioxygenase-like cupin family protein